MSVIQELWSEEDQAALDRFSTALEAGELAQCLLSIEDADEQTSSHVEQTLDRLAERVREVAEGSDAFSKAGALSHVIYEEFGLGGDTDDYFSTDNSHLSKVLDSKSGQPILVSAVWIIVAERAGIELEGVGLPQHFIVRLGNEGLFLDPFSGGSILSKADCKRIVRELSDGEIRWKDHFFESVSMVGIAERVLRNLCNSYSMSRNTIGLFRTVRFHAHMRPDLPQVHMLLGRLSEDFGDFTAARDAYRYVAETFPQHEEARLAEERLKELGEEPVLKN